MTDTSRADQMILQLVKECREHNGDYHWHTSDALLTEAESLAATLRADREAAPAPPYPDGYWQLRVEHARMQGAADGFQEGWHAVLTRLGSGDSVAELLALVPEPPGAARPGVAVAPPVCPHCQLPAVFPEVCTPELNAAIEANLTRDWSLLNAGFTIGQAGVAVAHQCTNGVHEWSNDFGDDWTPEKGTPCDCRQKQWGVAVAPKEPA